MPPPDDALRTVLQTAASQLDTPLTEAQATTLLAHLALLQRWNAVYNLTSVRDPAQMLTLHLVDCLAAVGPLRRHLMGKTPFSLLDVGSGAGLPGLVFAVLFPEGRVTCIDTVGKKAAFLQQAATELKLPNVTVVHGRVENQRNAAYDVITSRAFASLPDFTQLTRHLVTPSGCWLALKGKTPQAEFTALPPGIEVFHVEQLRAPGLDAERCLVWLRDTR